MRLRSSSLFLLLFVFPSDNTLCGEPKVTWTRIADGSGHAFGSAIADLGSTHAPGRYVAAGTTATGIPAVSSTYTVVFSESGEPASEILIPPDPGLRCHFASDVAVAGSRLFGVGYRTDCDVNETFAYTFIFDFDSGTGAGSIVGGVGRALYSTTLGEMEFLAVGECSGLSCLTAFRIEDGRELWSKTLRVGGVARAIARANTGELIIGGTSNGAGESFLAGLRNDGDVIWEERFGEGSIESVSVDSSGRAVAVGFAGRATPRDHPKVLFVSITVGGDVLWRREYGGDGFWTATGVAFTPDEDGAIVCGSGGIDDRDAWVWRVDDSGGIEWALALGEEHPDCADDVVVTDEGEYVIVGTWGRAFAQRSLFVAKITDSIDLFVRGDLDGSGSVDLSDAVFLLDALFRRGFPVCTSAADLDDDQRIGLVDALYLLNYLFLNGPSPSAPFPDAGIDPSGDSMDCR